MAKDYRKSLPDFTDDELKAEIRAEIDRKEEERAKEEERTRQLRAFGGNQNAVDTYNKVLAKFKK